MTALLECPLDPETQQPLLPPEPIEDEPAVGACTWIEGHRWVRRRDPVLGIDRGLCDHCEDPAPPWADLEPLQYFGRYKLRGAL